MIDTQDKLNAFVDTDRMGILAKALEEFNSTSDDDVWGTYRVSATYEMVDFNIYQQDDSPNLTVWAYALKHEDDNPEYTVTVNSVIGAFVAHVLFEEN